MGNYTIASCAGKEAFASRELASAIAQRMRRKRGCPVATYKCRACRQWHVGTQIVHVKHRNRRTR